MPKSEASSLGSGAGKHKTATKWEKARAEPVFIWEGNEYFQVRLHGSACQRLTLGRSPDSIQL